MATRSITRANSKGENGMDLPQTARDSIVQLVTLSAVPLIWWGLSARRLRRENFFSWIGLRRVRPAAGSARRFLVCAGLFLAYSAAAQFLIKPLLSDAVQLADDTFAGAGADGILPAALYAFIQTGLTEEILFRGFIGKRLGARFGFAVGNAAQGLLFGLLHGVLFFFFTTPGGALALILFTGAAGWLLGYADEKAAGGSILPSWLIHGGGNFVFALLKMFDLIG